MKKIIAILGICCVLPLIIVGLFGLWVFNLGEKSKEVLPLGVNTGELAQDFF